MRNTSPQSWVNKNLWAMEELQLVDSSSLLFDCLAGSVDSSHNIPFSVSCSIPHNATSNFVITILIILSRQSAQFGRS